MHAGNGPGLSDRRLGSKGGTETNTLSVAQLPSHSHTVTPKGASADADEDSPSGHFPGGGDFYAVRPLGAMGVDLEQGVLRLSFTHYTHHGEIQQLIGVLDKVLQRLAEYRERIAEIRSQCSWIPMQAPEQLV